MSKLNINEWLSARLLLTLAAIFAIGLTTTACRMGQEQWGPFRGQLVDAESKKPIAGASVMVSWSRDIPNPVHWTQRFYDAQETVTGSDGRFEIPRVSRVATLFVAEPAIGVFAPGYVPHRTLVSPSNGKPYVDSTLLEMRPLKTREERCKHEPLGMGLTPNSKVPRYATAVNEYVAALRCNEVGR